MFDDDFDLEFDDDFDLELDDVHDVLDAAKRRTETLDDIAREMASQLLYEAQSTHCDYGTEPFTDTIDSYLPEARDLIDRIVAAAKR